MRRRAAPLVLLALALVACSDTPARGPDDVVPTVGGGAESAEPAAPAEPAPGAATAPGTPATDPPRTATPAPPASASTATTPEVPNGPDPAAVRLELQEVAVLDAPIAMALRPGDATLYVAERAGRVRPVTSDGRVGAPIIDLADMTTTDGERGLLGLTWSEDGQTLYLSSTDTEGASVLTAVDVVDGVLQVEQARTLLRIPQPASNHNGGEVRVGPDGMLWWGLGDGGAADDRFGNGQRPDTLLATILRIDPTGADPYAIPADNPFADGQGGAPEVWAYGLRNPFRFSFDPATDSVWIADVGQDAVEEINRVRSGEAGLNFGWPRFEGDRPFDGQPAEGPTVAPVHTYTHDRGCSITGGRVYRGEALGPRMQGVYVYSDYCDGRIFALDVAPDGTVRADVDTGLDVASPAGFGVDAAGELYVLSLDGPVSRLVAA